MTSKNGKPEMRYDGFVPLQKGYTPLGHIQGGYRPTTGQGPQTAPASVPKQPSSVQPPKK
jgi:hypothetical protein